MKRKVKSTIDDLDNQSYLWKFSWWQFAGSIWDKCSQIVCDTEVERRRKERRERKEMRKEEKIEKREDNWNKESGRRVGNLGWRRWRSKIRRESEEVGFKMIS